MIRRVLESFATWSGMFVVGFAVAAYFLPQAPGGLVDPLRVVLYMTLAVATTILAGGHVALIARSNDGKVSLWLTTFTHSKVAQSFAYWGIVGIMVLRALGVASPVLEGIGYSMVGIAVGANVMAAWTFVVARRHRLLNLLIWPTLWGAWRHRRRKG